MYTPTKQERKEARIWGLKMAAFIFIMSAAIIVVSFEFADNWTTNHINKQLDAKYGEQYD